MKLTITRKALMADRPWMRGDEIIRIEDAVPAEGLPVTRENIERLRDAGVSDRDIFAALCHWCGVPARILRESACASARRALEQSRAEGREPDARSWRVIEVAERYARGEASLEEMREARDAATHRECYEATVVNFCALGCAHTHAGYAAHEAGIDGHIEELVARIEAAK